jgi:methionyl-tRNA synthetase
MNKKETFYVTTPIYYVTAKPHLGSLYSTLIADVLARWQQLNGCEIYFVTGTDEHGQKIDQAAKKANKDPKNFIDSFIPEYIDTWKQYDIAYNKFVRTTDNYHIVGAQSFIQKLIDNGDVYTSPYTGWYCTPCETFVLPKDSNSDEKGNIICTSCGRATEKLEEETYFFALSKYQDKLLNFYKNNPNFITPKERFNEVIRFVESGLQDLSISRTNVKWGVPFPNDPQHTIYVWAEALTNYITAIGYGDNNKQEKLNKWWPANIQVVGKDIVRFHGVFWPAFLMSAGFKLPKKLLVHGWITVDNKKMSKSLGNVVDPVDLANNYGVDEVRCYLLKNIPVNQDGNFSTADLEQYISSNLANDLGNLFNRMVTLAHKYNYSILPVQDNWQLEVKQLKKDAQEIINKFSHYMNECMFHLALSEVWRLINKVNAFFHAQEPWKQAKNDTNKFVQTLCATAHCLYIVAYCLLPVMPKKMRLLLHALGEKNIVNSFENAKLFDWNKSFKMEQIPVLFKKMDTKNMSQGHEDKKEQEKKEETIYITIDDFIKVEQCIGTIIACKEVEKSEKLLCLTVDFGDNGTRQILSGIKKWYKCEDLVGKQGVFVLNLKPRKMVGLESQGMMLFAKDQQGGLQMIIPSQQVKNGERVS